MKRTYWNEASSLGVCIDWFGPYPSFSSFKQDVSAEDKGTKIMYFAEDSTGSPEYVGITESAATRFSNHHKLETMGDEIGARFWYGIINSQGKSGRRTKPENKRKSAALDLDQAETALINWLWPSRNEVKATRRPSQTISISNRFFTKRKAKPRKGPEALPKVLFFDWISNRYTALHD